MNIDIDKELEKSLDRFDKLYNTAVERRRIPEAVKAESARAAIIKMLADKKEVEDLVDDQTHLDHLRNLFPEIDDPHELCQAVAREIARLRVEIEEHGKSQSAE